MRLGFCKIRLAGPCSDMITTPTPSKEWTQVDFCIHFFNYSPNSLPVSCRFVFLLLSTDSAPSAVFCALNSPELADKNNNILQRVCYHSHSISRGHGEFLPHGGRECYSIGHSPSPLLTKLGCTNISLVLIYIVLKR